MSTQTDKTKSDFALVQLLPNMLTVAAICAGLSAIRYGIQGHHTFAVQLIILAAVLDGLDGRLARLMNNDSLMGAELDSLADFLNFGVAPAMVLYFWTLQDSWPAAWICVMFYVVCCVMRLARFNVANKTQPKGDTDEAGGYFVGVPSPAGGLLVLLPMTLSFALPEMPELPDAAVCANLVLIGVLMISHLPTWSFKAVSVSRANVKFYLVGFACVMAAVLAYAWVTLVVLCLAYIGMVIWSLAYGKRA